MNNTIVLCEWLITSELLMNIEEHNCNRTWQRWVDYFSSSKKQRQQT